MNKTKDIEKFINQTVKKCDLEYDKTNLKLLFEEMTTDEISMFWRHYSSNIAARDSYFSTNHWETNLQKKYFNVISDSISYRSKNKDSNGKYIVDRDDKQVLVDDKLKMVDDEGFFDDGRKI